MNPQTPSTPQPSGEQPAPVTPEQVTGRPETLPQAAPELGTANANAATGATVAPTLTASDVAAAIAKMPAVAPGAAATPAAPAVASDQDVIEPEWVDQAEAVIAKTAGDPHAEEEAVEALQVDYLAKRYGHNVKQPDKDS